MNFFDRIESARTRWNVLRHPFYERWTLGTLERDELAFYAGQYRHAVVALAEAVGTAARAAEPAVRAELESHVAEERAHVGLWDEFAGEIGAEPDAAPLPETTACVESWTAGREGLEALAATYAIESAQPAIARSKLDGLLEHYGLEEGPATAYFSLHAALDVEHAAQSRELIEERLEGADEERLLGLAEGALRGNWTLLDGVERAFAARRG